MQAKVRDVMTPTAVSVGPEATLRELAELLSDHHITGVPVIAAGQGIVGIASATDILDFLAAAPGVPVERTDHVDWGEIRGPDVDTGTAADDDSYYVDMWSDAGADLVERFRDISSPEWNVLEEHTTEEVMSRRVITVAPDMDLAEAARTMQQNGVHRLLVVAEGAAPGMITTTDLLRVLAEPSAGTTEVAAAASVEDVSQRTVGDIMQHRVITVTPDTPLAQVARILWDEQVTGAPVVVEQGRPVGLISAADLMRYMAFGRRYQPPGGMPAEHPAGGSGGPAALRARRGRRLRRAMARDVMTPATFTVHSTTTVPELARFLADAGIHRALVVDGGELRGIVAASDIVQELARVARARGEQA
jgi:CBS domain-containing protein